MRLPPAQHKPESRGRGTLGQCAGERVVAQFDHNAVFFAMRECISPRADVTEPIMFYCRAYRDSGSISATRLVPRTFVVSKPEKFAARAPTERTRTCRIRALRSDALAKRDPLNWCSDTGNRDCRRRNIGQLL